MIYRYPREGQVAGVCVGLANYFGLSVWIVRLIFITLFLLGGMFFLPFAYLAAVFLMEKAPDSYYNLPVSRFAFGSNLHVSKAAQKLQQIRLESAHIKSRIQQLEQYAKTQRK